MTAKLNRKMSGKLEDKGNVSMMVGYAENHAGDVYRMLNLRTKKISLSRDICWLKKSYGEYMNLKKQGSEDSSDEEDEAPARHRPRPLGRHTD